MNLNAALSLLAHLPDGPVDLAEVALRLAQDEYPALDVEGYRAELVGWGRELSPHLRGPLLRRIERLNHYLFSELGFQGNREDYYDPRNSYLNEVMDRRRGLPITLTLVTMSVAAEAGLTVEGIGLPGHFIARAVAGDESLLFDPFNEGQILDVADCQRLVEQATGRTAALAAHSFTPIPPAAFVLRLLNNLRGVYARREDHARLARTLGRIRQLQPHDPDVLREESVALLHSGRPGRALELLREYQTRWPQAGDAATVREWIERAHSALARWN